MNLGLKDAGGEVLAISQFTLYGDVRKARRSSFAEAAGPDKAEPLYRQFCAMLVNRGNVVWQGAFQAHMQVSWYLTVLNAVA